MKYVRLFSTILIVNKLCDQFEDWFVVGVDSVFSVVVDGVIVLECVCYTKTHKSCSA